MRFRRFKAAVVDKAFQIVKSAEGDMLREKLMNNILLLRKELQLRGLDVYGDPSAIVAVKTGDEALARMTAKCLPEFGVIANLVEFPAVGKGLARFRMQVMAAHSEDEIRTAASGMQMAMAKAQTMLDAGFDVQPMQAAG